MATVSERIESAVTDIGDSATVAMQFIDPTNVSEIVRPNGNLKPLGLIQQQAESAISRIAHFEEDVFIASQVYTEQRIYFVFNSIAYTPLTMPFTAGETVQASIDDGTLTVLQGLTDNDVGDSAFKNVGKKAGEVLRAEDAVVTYDGASSIDSSELFYGKVIRLLSLQTEVEVGSATGWPDGRGGEYVVVASGTGVDRGFGSFIDVGDFQLKKVTDKYSAVDDLIDSHATAGEKVSTGHTTWKITSIKPKRGVQLNSGLFAMPLNGVHIDDFGAAPLEWLESLVPASYTDSTTQINNALDTGATVIAGYGTYICSDELLMMTSGQKFRGEGGGSCQLNFFARKQGASWQTRFLFTGSPEKYVKTRRQNRLSSSDPQDAPMAVALNIEEEYVDVSGIFIDLSCDYGNLGPYNLGSDFDCGVFVGGRVGVHLKDIKVRGYFRVASFYIDNTRLNDLDGVLQFSTPAGRAYPVGDGVLNGTDKFNAEDLVACGGHKGFFVAGPKDGRPLSYYDEIAGELVPDSRGGYGTSDWTISQSFFGGPDHHSGVRRYDPPLNDAGTRIDPAKVDIDAAAGSYFYDSLPSRQSRRVKFDTCRFTTIEAIRIFIGNGLEMIFDNPVTESLSGTVYATDGVTVINQYDYTLQSFKDIACYATDYMGDDTGARRVSFLQSGGNPNPNYFQNLVSEHYVTIVGNDPSGGDPDIYSGYWLHVLEPTTESIKVTVKDHSPFYMVQIEAEWAGLDVTDVSAATIACSDGENMKIGDNGILRVDTDLSTGINFAASDIVELYLEGQDSAFSRFQLMVNGIRRDYRDGELLAAGRLVAVGLTCYSSF
ncbi:MAG: hypothetical protein RPR28_11590 [Cycloclasticus sp.]|jgi:hypothetical protein